MSQGDPTRRAYRSILASARGSASTVTPAAVPKPSQELAELNQQLARPRRSIARWIGLTMLGSLCLLALTLAGFRIAAAMRETDTAAALAPKSGQFVTTPDGRIFLQDSGPRDGIPVVLIHGTAAWSEFWRGTIDHLTGHNYRVIAVDLPPFGFSDRSPNAAYSRTDQAHRLVAALGALNIEQAIFVGHSFGAGATVELVMRFPKRVRGLVLVAAALGLPEAGQMPALPPTPLIAALELPILPEVIVAATGTNPLLTRHLLSAMIARKEAATPELADILRKPMTRVGTAHEVATRQPAAREGREPEWRCR
jgi:pimeloyl-ACP methyl ester carboxylesterase